MLLDFYFYLFLFIFFSSKLALQVSEARWQPRRWPSLHAPPAKPRLTSPIVPRRDRDEGRATRDREGGIPGVSVSGCHT